MSRTAIINKEVIERARDILETKPIHQDALRALSIMLPAIMGATIQQTAAVLCVSTATVTRLQAEVRNQELRKDKGAWGGRSNGMNTLQANQPTVKSLSVWPWIVNAITSS
jgi:hypothetical protein